VVGEVKVLIVTSRFPLPAWRGNQVRTVEWLSALDGSERQLVCPRPSEPTTVAELEGMAEALHLHRLPAVSRFAAALGASIVGRPAQEGLYDTPDARAAVRKSLEQLHPEVVVVQMVRCGWALEIVRTHEPEAAIVFDAIDSMGLHFARGSHRAPFVLRPLWSTESARCRRREQELTRRSELTTAVSERDLDALRADPARRVVVPVSGREMGLAHPDSDRPIVLLSGNLGYRPTVAAATWFARRVWPQLAARVPNARWLLVGARPHRAIRRLDRIANVEVHADVADMAPYLRQATVAIAPMAIGSGLSMKVIEAWSAGVPVLADPWTAAGLGPEGRDAVATASGESEWLTEVHRLLTDVEAARDLGGRGHRQWTRRFGRESVFESVRGAVVRAVEIRRLG
jgi:hypothetical protein